MRPRTELVICRRGWGRSWWARLLGIRGIDIKITQDQDVTYFYNVPKVLAQALLTAGKENSGSDTSKL